MAWNGRKAPPTLRTEVSFTDKFQLVLVISTAKLAIRLCFSVDARRGRGRATGTNRKGTVIAESPEFHDGCEQDAVFLDLELSANNRVHVASTLPEDFVI